MWPQAPHCSQQLSGSHVKMELWLHQHPGGIQGWEGAEPRESGEPGSITPSIITKILAPLLKTSTQAAVFSPSKMITPKALFHPILFHSRSSKYTCPPPLPLLGAAQAPLRIALVKRKLSGLKCETILRMRSPVFLGRTCVMGKCIHRTN